MSEEETKKEDNVVIDQKQMDSIDKEIGKVEGSQLDAAKKEGVEAGKKELLAEQKAVADESRIGKLEAELKALKEEKTKTPETEPTEKKEPEAKPEPEKVEEKAEEKPQRRGVVPESDNPTQAKEETPAPEIQKSTKDQWAEFGAAVRTGSFSATTDKV